jgi:hypothetical protein
MHVGRGAEQIIFYTIIDPLGSDSLIKLGICISVDIREVVWRDCKLYSSITG